MEPAPPLPSGRPSNPGPSISGWMASVVVGTYLGAWGFATASALVHGSAIRWVVLMAVCSALAAVQVVVLSAVDVLLLWAKLRMLPSGRRAWNGSVLASALVWCVGLAWPFSRWTSPLTFVGSILLPMVVVSVGVRWFLGERP